MILNDKGRQSSGRSEARPPLTDASGKRGILARLLRCVVDGGPLHKFFQGETIGGDNPPLVEEGLHEPIEDDAVVKIWPFPVRSLPQVTGRTVGRKAVVEAWLAPESVHGGNGLVEYFADTFERVDQAIEPHRFAADQSPLLEEVPLISGEVNKIVLLVEPSQRRESLSLAVADLNRKGDMSVFAKIEAEERMGEGAVGQFMVDEVEALQLGKVHGPTFPSFVGLALWVILEMAEIVEGHGGSLDMRGRQAGPAGLPVGPGTGCFERPGDGYDPHGDCPAQKASPTRAQGHHGEEHHQGIADGEQGPAPVPLVWQGGIVVDGASGPYDAEKVQECAKEGE